MKDVRYLVRLPNTDHCLPRDQANLLRRIRSLVEPLQGNAVNLRVSSQALEFDLFLPPALDLAEGLRALSVFGSPLTSHRLENRPETRTATEIVREARSLYKEHRFWEVHEVLEGLWTRLKGDERALVQALIIAAAAFVHFQRDESDIAWRMVQDAHQRLLAAPDFFEGLSLNDFRHALGAMIYRREINFPPF